MLAFIWFLSGFFLFSFDLLAIVIVARQGVVAASGVKTSGKTVVGVALALLIKTVAIVLAYAVLLNYFEADPIPLFLGSLFSLLCFGFWATLKKLSMSQTN